MTSPFNTIHNKRVSRTCLLKQNAGLRQYKSDVSVHQKLLRHHSRAFMQSVLLNLAENSQIRHQRETRISTLTKMFRVPLDETEPQQVMESAFVKEKKVEINPKEKKKIMDEEKTKSTEQQSDKQSVQRESSVISEISASSSHDDHRHRQLSFRSRALSISFINSITKEVTRRLSAPEVVITPAVAKETDNFLRVRDGAEEKADEVTAAPNLSLRTLSCDVDDTSNLSSATSQQHQRESVASPLRGTIRSPFKSYSKASPILLRRFGSHDSSSSRKGRTKQESIPCEDVPNPFQDKRFLDLISQLHLFYGPSGTSSIADAAMSLKKTSVT